MRYKLTGRDASKCPPVAIMLSLDDATALSVLGAALLGLGTQILVVGIMQGVSYS